MRTVAHKTTMISILVLLSAGIVALVGCSNSSGPSEPGYLEPTSPENVLLNVERAYGERDLEEYLDCMSEDFRFHFTEEDQQGWPELPPWFYKPDEQQVHENMFGDEWEVESISLALVVASVETIPAAVAHDAAGDVVRIRVLTDLRVNLLGDITYLATNPQNFYFREVSDANGRDGRTLWEMFEWEDTEGWDAGTRVEETGWGAIKYLFLESLSEPSRRTSPAEVIDQLEAAYTAMNVTDYIDCLSEDFVFYPCEMDVQNPDLDIPSEWYRSMEQIIHFNMFDAASPVTSVQLTLTNIYVFWDEQDPEDPLDDIYSHTEDVDLWVNLNDGYVSYLADAPQHYLLRVDPDEVGPYGELMWEIYEWYDLDGEGRGGGSDGRENDTWGGIKAMFREPWWRQGSRHEGF